MLIEPRQAFAIADFGLLIETSVSNAYAARDSQLKDFFFAPSPVKYFKARLTHAFRTDLKDVIVLGTAWPFNYFHFYRDFLPKVLLLDEAHINSDIPVIVPDELFDQPFFREAIHSSRLSRWTFVAPRGRFIRCDSVVFCSANQFFLLDRRMSSEEDLFTRACEGTKYLESPGDVLALLDLDGATKSSPERRIFLTRSRARTRNLSNYDEVEPLLRERNFETVDTDGMALRDQAQLFRECRYLVAIHGAGIVNIIHAHQHELNVLEIRQPGEEHLLTDFAAMCHAYEFYHREIFGTADPRLEALAPVGPGNRDGSFRIDVELLRGALDEMLESPNRR